VSAQESNGADDQRPMPPRVTKSQAAYKASLDHIMVCPGCLSGVNCETALELKQAHRAAREHGGVA
jgi:hypothetical protein